MTAHGNGPGHPSYDGDRGRLAVPVQLVGTPSSGGASSTWPESSVVISASPMSCHRNTVIYRMKQIERLTGRHLADPRDKMLLWLAVTAHAA